MKICLSVAAVLAWLLGIALLFAPGAFNAPIGSDMTARLDSVTQAYGATLIGLGVLDWLGRDAGRRGQIAVFAGNLVVQVLSLYVVVRTALPGAGWVVAPGAVMHLVLGTWFAYSLTKSTRLAS